MRDQVLMRLVFRTRYGKVDELLSLMRKNEALVAELYPNTFPDLRFRYLVDYGGDMFHVVTETLASPANFIQWMQQVDEMYQHVEYKVWFNQMVTCTEAGTRELWRVHAAPPRFSDARAGVCARNVYQARYGKADALVEHLMTESKLAQRHDIPPLALYTDLSGPMFTVVSSRDHDSLAAWEQTLQKIDALPEYGQWRKQLLGMVEVGRREFYKLV